MGRTNNNKLYCGAVGTSVDFLSVSLALTNLPQGLS